MRENKYRKAVRTLLPESSDWWREYVEEEEYTATTGVQHWPLTVAIHSIPDYTKDRLLGSFSYKTQTGLSD